MIKQSCNYGDFFLIGLVCVSYAKKKKKQKQTNANIL